MNGPSFPVGDAGEPGGTLSADGGSDSGGGTVTDAGDAGDDAGTDPGPFPLGATWGTNAVHFRVRADAATAVLLDVYTTPQGADEVASFPMTQGAPNNAWGADVPHAQLAALGITSVVYYGYRAWGPNWPVDPAWTKGSSAGFVADVDSLGNRYNPNKLLIDPYTHEISNDPLEPGALSSSPYNTGPNDRATDDGHVAPKSIVMAPVASDVGSHPTGALKDDVIYEVNVRGLTMNDPTVPAAIQGTYAGAATKAASLAALGVTAVELLPIHETQNDQNDVATGDQNYWGYSTLAFFAPDRRYASNKTPGGPTAEFQAMVSAFHASGIKVFLDVVYNHTAEGGVSSSNLSVAQIFSFRGLDNAGYYELAADNQTPVDDTGTGGNFGTGTQIVRDLVIDSLTYWQTAMGVDGFRFDLAAVLGNSCTSACFQFDPTDPNGILLRAVNDLPARPAAGGTGVDLIAEPWGVGTGTYQLGNFPAGWSEWNGDFRDSIRIAQNELGTTPTTPSTLVTRIEGSPDLFNQNGRAPSASISFVSCHDGFTLHDEYAYDAPENDQPYPLGPSTGGSTTDYPWDQGVAADAGSTEPQTQAARTGLALVAVSVGVPMLQGGDEMLRTQYGNNNAYNLDDSAMWLDWSLATTNASFVSWTTALFAFRAAHPALRPATFFTGTDHNGNGLPDIEWLDNTGAVASAAYLANTANHFLAWRIDGTEAADPAYSLLFVWNGWTADISMPVPVAATGTTWWSVGDSASGTFALPGSETSFAGTVVDAPPRSVTVLIER
ncbi:MAG: alpha-amylase family glycosyl hydrolase [Polyangiaceae bacterium]